MNKVVPTILTLSALLFVAGCSNSDSRSSSHSGRSATNAAFATQGQAACSACGTGQAVGHTHTNSNQVGNALRHTHSGASGHAHNGYSAGYGYTVDAGVTAGRNTIGNSLVSNGVRTGAAASSGGAGNSVLLKAAGALLVGGLLFAAIDDDDDDDDRSSGQQGGDDGQQGGDNGQQGGDDGQQGGNDGQQGGDDDKK